MRRGSRASLAIGMGRGMELSKDLAAPPSLSSTGSGAGVALSEKKDYIDAVRGWAILLVITAHVGGMFPGMPYPIKKLTNFGTYGVQMFFLASAVTLLMSWHRRSMVEDRPVASFFIRRFFRIAPMYYIGAMIYFVAEPPDSGFSAAQMLRSFAFINAWTPEWTPTTPAWAVVPGGWSIGVEFTFYFIFPALAVLIVTLPRVAILCACALEVAAISNYFGLELLNGYSAEATSNFLYFWFPNQAPVFAFGFLLYFLVTRTSLRITNRLTAYGLLAATIAICVIAAEHHSASNRLSWGTGVPTILIATWAFMGFIFVLARGPETLCTHKYIRRLGVLSFSAYVLHFLFVHKIPTWSGGLIDPHATSYTRLAISAVALWVLGMACTVAATEMAHRLIEQPGIHLGRRLIAQIRGAGLSIKAGVRDA